MIQCECGAHIPHGAHDFFVLVDARPLEFDLPVVIHNASVALGAQAGVKVYTFQETPIQDGGIGHC